MRLAFFTVPTLAPGEAGEELNRFLAGHRVAAVEQHLVTHGPSAYWAICVTYLLPGGAKIGRGSKIDYKEVLPAAEFAVFAQLRALRKEIADREGVPAYALFTNEQLAAMVTGNVQTSADLAGLPGVGQARVEKYAEPFLELLRRPGEERKVDDG